MTENVEQIVHSQTDDAAMDLGLSKILQKYKSSTYSKEELNLRIEVDKVIYVLNRGVAKLEVLAKLPYFLENDAVILLKHFKKFEGFAIIDVLNSYGAKYPNKFYEDFDFKNYIQSFKALLLETSNKNNFKLDNQLTIDPLVYQIIDILFYNKCVKTTLQSTRHIKGDNTVTKLMKTFREFRNILREKMYVSGDTQIAIDKKLRSAYKTSILQVANIKELEEQLHKQRRELGNQLQNKVQLLKMNRRRMNKIKEDFSMYISNELHESEKSMMHASLKSEQHQLELTEEAQKLKKQYEMLLEDHLGEEKIARTKRMKLEAQLQNWLTTFDQDIGERQSQYEILHKEYTENKAELEDLQKKIAEQEEEYNILMEEKRIEEERIFNEMAYQILMNRSARIIQRYWRAFWERRQARRKGRKGKGKGKQDKRRTPKPVVTRTTDVTGVLSSDKKIKSHVFEELANPESDVFKVTD